MLVNVRVARSQSIFTCFAIFNLTGIRCGRPVITNLFMKASPIPRAIGTKGILAAKFAFKMAPKA